MNSSIQTLQSIFEILLSKIQTGLTLSDIENALFFIIFARFLILAIRYNFRTSFYITCIGLFAGYLWYKHLIDLTLLYRNILLKVPFFSGLGVDAIEMRLKKSEMTLESLSNTETINASNPGDVFYFFVTKKENNIDYYYIDPLSMLIANLNEPYKSKILPFYYQIYNKIIPTIFLICTKFWTQISGLAAYAFITRIGKKYCPYLVRWHWTFLIIIGLAEQTLIFFARRILYFETFVLIPQIAIFPNSFNLILKLNLLTFLLNSILFFHIGFIIFGLFHAIWGQYFYFPFFVENTELHIGPRPRNTIYSGGQTAWQYPDEKNLIRLFPKIWFGWFGSGTYSKKFYPYPKEGIIIRRLIKKTKRFYKKFSRRIKKIFQK